MALGHGMPDARQDQEGRLDRRAPPEESKKRIWERLGPVPQLAGEFEASDEFEPPRKVLSADTLGRANRRCAPCYSCLAWTTVKLDVPKGANQSAFSF